MRYLRREQSAALDWGIVVRASGWCLAAILLAGCGARAQAWGTGIEVDRDPSVDWAAEPTKEAFARYDSKRGDFSCSKLREYVATNDTWAAYFAIRDAGLFLDKSCSVHVEPHKQSLQARPITQMALAFYEARRGSARALDALIAMFDESAMESPTGPSTDDLVVSLLGFFSDWDKTGRRLLRHAKFADGAAATESGNALGWKKHLYGKDAGYQANCARAAKDENVDVDLAPLLCDPPLHRALAPE